MTESNQHQKAGANSSQYQIAGNLVVYEGVSEERAYEISKKAFRDMYEKYSEESYPTAAGRVEQLDMRYIPRLAGAGRLGALADPAFQVTLRKAQLGAASTERDSDYELLAGLLSDRAERADSRPVRAGINRAVEVVDQIDDESLTGLTVMSLALSVIPTAGGVEGGVEALEKILAPVMEGQPLPAGREWLEHLDILDAVRIDRIQEFKPFKEHWCERTPGYLATGALAGSVEDLEGSREFGDMGLPNMVIDHELKPGYRRIASPTVGVLTQWLEAEKVPEHLHERAQRIASDVYGLGRIDNDLTSGFMERVYASPHQARLGAWWDAFPHHFSLTVVGKVLARANLKHLDSEGIFRGLDGESLAD